MSPIGQPHFIERYNPYFVWRKYDENYEIIEEKIFWNAYAFIYDEDICSSIIGYLNGYERILRNYYGEVTDVVISFYDVGLLVKNDEVVICDVSPLSGFYLHMTNEYKFMCPQLFFFDFDDAVKECVSEEYSG